LAVFLQKSGGTGKEKFETFILPKGLLMKKLIASTVYLLILSIGFSRSPKMYASKPGYFVDKVHLKGDQMYAFVRVTGPFAGTRLRRRS